MQPVLELTQAELNQILTNGGQEFDPANPCRPVSRGTACVSARYPQTVMRQVCAELNDAGLDADIVFILSPRQAAEAPWQISATRLIELRNEEKRAVAGLYSTRVEGCRRRLV